MNLIKSPQEILLDEAHIPHMADGGALGKLLRSEGAELLFKQASRKLEQMFGRKLTGEETQQLMQEVNATSKPTSQVRQNLTPAQAARNQYELATDPNLINPNTAKDEFLTQSMFGRGQKGTEQAPKTLDITAPEVAERIEAQQMGGELNKLIPNAEQGSITPGADYLANMAQAKQNFALANSNILDKLKEAFFKENKRLPDAEELDQLVAAYNPLRHQYGEKGASIVTERPPTAKGMSAWRESARMEGIPESYLNKQPADYRQNLKNELEIEQGIVPATRTVEERVRKTREIEPSDSYFDPESGAFVNVYPTQKAEGGSITPREMLAKMVVQGHTPQRFAQGGQPKKDQYEGMSPYEVKGSVPRYDIGESTVGPIPTQHASRMVHDAAADLIGLTAADRVFGGPRADAADRVVLQTFNPVNYVTGTVDELENAYDAVKRKDYPSAALSTGFAGLSALPFVGRGLSLAKRAGQVFNPMKNKANLVLSGLSEMSGQHKK